MLLTDFQPYDSDFLHLQIQPKLTDTPDSMSNSRGSEIEAIRAITGRTLEKR